MSVRFPTRGDAITPALLTELISATYPGVSVAECRLVQEWTYGTGAVSAAARVALEVRYAAAAAAADLPTRLVVKIDRASNSPYPIYANEVEVYSRLRPSGIIEAPVFLGGCFDTESGALGLILEDLSERGATFPDVLGTTGVDHVRAVIGQLAKLHATFWNSPRLASDLGWMQSHVAGPIHALYSDPDKRPAVIARELETMQFKREMVQRLGTTIGEMARLTGLAHRHQATLPQTVCHGDAHLGNTYALPDGSVGLIDWQLCVRGSCMHDLSYLLATALPIADRRAHERELLGYYAQRLRAGGVAEVPDAEWLWREYRRAALWGVYIGWLTTPVVNYGWEITVGNLLRVTTAVEDLGTLAELRALFA